MGSTRCVDVLAHCTVLMSLYLFKTGQPFGKKKLSNCLIKNLKLSHGVSSAWVPAVVRLSDKCACTIKCESLRGFRAKLVTAL
jgi:hypothetical protein